MVSFAGFPAARPDESTIRLAIADDVSLFRRQLMVGLERAEDLEVMAEATDADSLLTKVSELSPDVVILGMQLPSFGALAAIAALDAVSPGIPVIVVTTPDDGPDALRAARAGAIGFVARELAVADCVAATRAVARGRPVLPPRMATALLAEYESLRRQTGSLQQRLVPPHLEHREERVLEQLGSGASLVEAADEVGVSRMTALNLAGNALRKLQRHARAESAISHQGPRIAAVS